MSVTLETLSAEEMADLRALKMREDAEVSTTAKVAAINTAKAAALTVIGLAALAAAVKILAPKGVLPSVHIIRQDTTPNIFVTEQQVLTGEKPVGA